MNQLFKQYVFRGLPVLFLKALIVCAATISVKAQDAAVVTPPAYNTYLKNFVRSWEVNKPETNPNLIDSSNTTQVSTMTTVYFDGFGRPIQSVVKQGTSSDGAADLVTPTIYDDYGRVVRSYLPFAANNTGGNTAIANGSFKMNPFQQQKWFYSDANTNSPVKGQGDTMYYGKTEYEASPLNRVDRVYAPGNDWVRAGRGVTTKYWTNTLVDSVRLWKVTNSGVIGTFGTYNGDSIYKAAELMKTVTTDEHNRQVIEFRDKQDRVILKKVQFFAAADNGTGKGHTGWYCTYYIYDNFGQLRCVVQPKGVELLAANSWNMTWSSSVILSEQCFRYEYDGKRRMQMKKVPGAGEVYMVYDARDRLVLTQDANMRTGSPVKWLYTAYDSLNRVKETGLWNNSTALAAHYSSAYASTSYPNLSGQTIEVLTNTYYDNYNWSGNPFATTRVTTYDTYLRPAADGTFPYIQSVAQSNFTKGLVTGTKAKVTSTSLYLYSTTFYDHAGRPIQVQSTNMMGGTEFQINQYAFNGKPVLNLNKMEKTGTNAQTTLSVTHYDYSNNWFLTTTGHKFSNSKTGAMSALKTIATHTYNAMGQLRQKALGSGLETQVHDYNIRGWLLGVNRDYAKTAASITNYFGFDLGYNKTAITPTTGTALGSYTAAQYNGNIGGMVWKSTGDDEVRKYDFSYDVVNRLAGADFNQYTSSSFNKTAGMDFSVRGLSYDANGNILTMRQMGRKATSSALIDSLNYTYLANTNRLQKVVDLVTADNKLGDFFDGTNGTNDDYAYDANGNMVKDRNKELRQFNDGNGIGYNHLNLPLQIIVKKDASSNRGNIVFLYNAANGSKLRKTVTEGSTTTTTNYASGAVYRNDTMEFFAMDEGRVRYHPAKNKFFYDYFVKDHLGNVRMVLTEEKDTSIYPAATFEAATTATEQIYYEKAGDARTARPSAFFTAGTNGSYVQLLQKSTQSIGVGKLLKVMAKDRLHVQVDYYTPTATVNNTSANGLNALIQVLGTLLNTSPVASVFHGSASTVTTNLNASAPFTSFLAPQTGSGTTTLPKAYLNILFFDEQFRFVSTNSTIIQISTVNSGQTITVVGASAKEAVKNGYAYVYVSNESDNLVYFDNLRLTHEKGPILEETHYYSFGGTMKGISSRAIYNPINKNQLFQGQPLDDELGLNCYGFKYRNHDPQIGRFIQIDPLSDKYVYNSTYAFSENKVTAHVELEGLESLSIQGLKDQLWQSLGISKSYSGKEFAEDLGKAAKRPEPYMAAGQMLGQFTVLTLVGIAAEGFGAGSLLNVGSKSIRNTAADALQSTALVTKYPGIPEVAGTAERTFLMPGQVIDRYGGLGGRWFSTPGTPYGARSIPSGLSPYTQFEVLKPFEVQKSLASPGMFNGQTGFGTQFQSPVGADILIKRKIITPFQ